MFGLLFNGNINLNGIDIYENVSCYYEWIL